MPYIKLERRHAIDPFIQHLSQRIAGREELVYTLIMLAATEVRSATYPELASVYGDMVSAAEEFKRRIMTPVLDSECVENGDMFKMPEPVKPKLKSV